MSALSKYTNLFSILRFSWPYYDKNLDTKKAKYIVGGALVGLIVIRLMKRSDIPSECFPADKKENFAIVTERAKRGDLPRLFWANGYFPLNLKEMLVISDFDLLEKTFKSPVVSDRITWSKNSK